MPKVHKEWFSIWDSYRVAFIDGWENDSSVRSPLIAVKYLVSWLAGGAPEK